jgi:hypothetical protein
MIKKRNFLLFISIFILSQSLIWNPLNAQQSPQEINYQAVARDAEGQELSGVSLDVEFSIYEFSPDGNPVYTEIHSDVLTDPYGLFNLKIGGGTPISGSFTSIQWANETWLSVGVDAGNGMIDLGSYKLISVPYAFYASKADSANYGADADADPLNEIQDIGINTNDPQNIIISLENANPISFSIEDADADSLNEIQQLLLTGAVLSLTNDDGGVEVDLASFNTDDQELSILSSTAQNVELALENSPTVNFSIEDADSDPGNELQELNLDGNVLSLSDDPSGTQVNLASFNTDDQALSINTSNPQNQVISLANSPSVSFSIEDADADPGNELVSAFTFNNATNDLTITEGGIGSTVNLDELKTDQNWELNGQNIHNLNTGNVGINEINPSSTLQIMGSTAVKVRVEGPSGSNYLLGDETVFIGKPDIGDVEVDLPFAADVPGRIYIIKKANPSTFNDLKVHASGSDLIEGESTYIMGDVSGVYEQIMIVSDGVSEWWIISKE